MENFRQEISLRSTLREATFNNKFAAEDSTLICSLFRAYNVSLDIRNIAFFILIENYTVGWVFDQVELLFA